MDAREWKKGDTCYVVTNKEKRQSAEYTVLSFDGRYYFLESRTGEPYPCIPIPDVPVKGRSICFYRIGGGHVAGTNAGNGTDKKKQLEQGQRCVQYEG